MTEYSIVLSVIFLPLGTKPALEFLKTKGIALSGQAEALIQKVQTELAQRINTSL